MKSLLLFIDSALQGRDIVMHPEMGQCLVSLHSQVVSQGASFWETKEGVFKEQQQQQQLGAGVMASLGAAIAGSVESLCLPRRRLMNSKSPRSLGGTLGDNCSSIQQPYFQCVLKVRMAASPTALCIAVLQLSSTESRPPDAVRSRNPKASTEPLFLLYPGHQTWSRI
jgi:hypothetical protein